MKLLLSCYHAAMLPASLQCIPAATRACVLLIQRVCRPLCCMHVPVKWQLRLAGRQVAGQAARVIQERSRCDSRHCA